MKKWSLIIIFAIGLALLLMTRSGSAPDNFIATHYDSSLAGGTLGCSGMGVYDPQNPEIIAVSPDLYSVFPCGTRLIVEAPTGIVLRGVRMDSCPGCGKDHIDLSDAGIVQLCGQPCDIITGLKVERVP